METICAQNNLADCFENKLSTFQEIKASEDTKIESDDKIRNKLIKSIYSIMYDSF